MSNKKLLIFTGVGDHEDHFLSWAKNQNFKFDRALNYYGTDETRLNQIQDYQPEFFYSNTGEIWTNFCRNFQDYDDYDYYLIVDSDLILDPSHLEETLSYVIDHGVNGSTWSRSKDSYGYFTPLFLPRQINSPIYFSNWIEMCFMLLTKDLVKKTMKKWGELDLQWCGGIDFVVSNIALENDMLPFVIFNNYLFRNVPPSEKANGREIDHATNSTVSERLFRVMDLIENDDFFRIKGNHVLTWEK